MSMHSARHRGPAFIEKIHDAHIPNKTRPNENPGDHDYRQYDYVYENINQFVVLANSGKYFGNSHDNKERGIHYIIASARSTDSAFIQRHELGHGLFHLGDEYNYSRVPIDEANYTTSLNMTATKDPTKVKWKKLLGFRNTYTCPHYDNYPYTYNSSRDCLMRETFKNDFCDVCKLQGIKVMSQLIKNPPALYVAVPEVKKYIGDYKDPTKDPSAFEAANSSAYASYQYNRNSRLLSGGSKNNFDYGSMKGQQVELRTIIQNLSATEAKTVTLRLWVEHPNGDKAVTADGKQVFTTQEFNIPAWSEKSKFWPKGALDYKGSDFDSGLVNCSLVYTIPENAILQSGDTIGFDIVDRATGEVLADDDTEQQRYVDVTIQYQLEDGTDVPNTMPTTFTVPVGKRVDWQPPQELHGYVFVRAEGMEGTVPSNGMTIRYIYKRSEERPEPPVTKNYTVRYDWGDVFPTDEKLPQNSNSYSSVQQAKAAVDKNYTDTTRIKAQKDGKNGTWAFSGWDAGNLNGTTVVFRGSWSFTEVYDPLTDAWYWFDQDGTMATDKDVFIPTNAERTEGKWVRYNPEGGMVKGEDFRYGGWYWFNPITGEMIKDFAFIPEEGTEGKWVYYDKINGQMHHGESCIDGNWYYFDEWTGKMVHGEYYRDNNWYYYDDVTGIMAHGWVTLPNGERAYYDEVTGVRR